MGVLEKTTNTNAVKTVIIESLDKEDCFEIARVYKGNEDFDVICEFPLNLPTIFSRESVHRFLRMHNNLPVYTCKISKKLDKMSKEEAFKLILNTTELWEGGGLNENYLSYWRCL